MSLFPEFMSRWLVGSPGYAEDPEVFPLLPGQTLLSGKSPIWSTQVTTSSSGRERRRSNWSYPRWRIRAKYDVIRDRPSKPELARMYAFFCLHLGQRTPFRFFDPYDHTVVDQIVGVGDGTQTTFQLTRSIASGLVSFSEPVRRVATPTIMLNGTPTSNFTIDALGRVILDSAPGAGVVVSWSGDFFFLCRFTSDEMDPEQMTYDLWSLAGIELLTVKR